MPVLIDNPTMFTRIVPAKFCGFRDARLQVVRSSRVTEVKVRRLTESLQRGTPGGALV
jgi:hypothetical protein